MNQNNINNNSRNVELEELKQPNIINNDDNDEILTDIQVEKVNEDNKEENKNENKNKENKIDLID
jgi:hypothetical protein